MGIKVGVLDADVQYMNRFQAYCEIYYTEELEIIPFDSIEMVNTYLEKSKLLMLLVGNQNWSKDIEFVKPISIIKFVNHREECEESNKYIVFKYQKLEEIYKKLLDVAAEEGASYVIRKEAGGTEIVLFTSPQGGVGKTSVAIAYGEAMVSRGKKVCYLPLEPCGSTDVYFNEEDSATLSDVIFVLKSKKQNISLKLESVMSRAGSGMQYFKSCANPSDVLELTPEDVRRLVTALKDLGKFDLVIIDYTMNFKDEFYVLHILADKVVLLNDGTQTGNHKMLNAIEILKIEEDRHEESYLHKYKILFNKFSTHTSGSRMLEDTVLESVGIIPYISGGSEKEKISQIARDAVVEQI